MRILLAEDDASQAESIKDWLEMDGYSVDWVERGDHADTIEESDQWVEEVVSGKLATVRRPPELLTRDVVAKAINDTHAITYI